VQRGAKVTFTFNGRPIEAHAGEMLAAALMAAGIFRLRSSPSWGGPRGAFCLMGVCQECLVRVGGRLQQSCIVRVQDGLKVGRTEAPEVPT
jgi:predicted molibdopterin-dependent oxidoreductase YjgC